MACDRNIPVMNGIELLRAIRADENLKTIPVLMVMADAKPGKYSASRTSQSQHLYCQAVQCRDAAREVEQDFSEIVALKWEINRG